VPEFVSPIGDELLVQLNGARLDDLSGTPINRSWVDRGHVSLGTARRNESVLAFSISPGEWIEIGASPANAEDVDISHVRALLRLTGDGAAFLLSHLCAIDLGDQMMPNGAAARTLVAGVATEIVRDDKAQHPSYLLMMSRSFARHVWDRFTEVSAHASA